MVQTIAAENVTLEQLILLYGLELVDSEEFFREWQDDLLELTSLEKQLLDQIKAGYISVLLLNSEFCCNYLPNLLGIPSQPPGIVPLVFSPPQVQQ